jgi:hypothetical protein
MTKTRKLTSQNQYQMAEDAFTAEGGAIFQGAVRSATAVAVQWELDRVMSEFSIRRIGPGFECHGEHHECLHDAVRYAWSLRTAAPISPPAHSPEKNIPSAADRQVMTSMGIEFAAGRYRVVMHCDHLNEAVDYASLVMRKAPHDIVQSTAVRVAS